MEESRQNKIMEASFVNDLVGQVEDEKKEDVVVGGVKRKRGSRHSHAGRVRETAMKKQKKLDMVNYVDMLFCQSGDVEPWWLHSWDDEMFEGETIVCIEDLYKLLYFL